MRRAIVWLAAGLCALIAGIYGGIAIKLIAFPIAAVCFLALPWPSRDRTDSYRRLLELFGPALLIVLCAKLYSPLLAGHLSVNHDHPVLFLQAWVTGAQLIPSGHLTGFSETMYAGYPANSLYPMGTSLLVVAMKALSLGRASWETAYAWALFLAVLAYPLALYALGRRALGPLAGLTAGLLGVFDHGSWVQSGWEFNIFFGVWSMGLSFSLCLWSLWAVDRLAIRPGRFTLVGTAAVVAGALLCHPMAVALLAISIPLYLLMLALTGSLPAPRLWLPRVVGGLALGSGLAAWWYLPFVTYQDYFEPLARSWRPFENVINGLFEGKVLNQLSPLLMLGGIFGLILAANRRNEQGWFWLISAGLLLFYSTDDGLLAFGLLKRFPSLGNLQLQRFAYLIRTAALLGVGFLVDILARGPEREPTAEPEPVFRRHARRLLAAAIATPFLIFGIRFYPPSYFIPDDPLHYEYKSLRYLDLRAAADYLNTRDRSELGRILVVDGYNDHLMLVLPVYTNLPIFKLGFTPEDNYRYKFMSADPEVWKFLNISHALSAVPLPMGQMKEEKRFGQLRLYRFLPFSRQRCSLTGQGRVEVLRDEPEAMDVRIRDAKPGDWLRIYKSRFALWRAELDGVQAPIHGFSLGDTPAVFMQSRIHNGLFKLRFRPGAVGWTGVALSWLSLGISLALLLSRFLAPEGGWRRLLASAAAPISRAVSATVLAVIILGSIGLALLLILSPPSPFSGRAVVTDLADLLPRAVGQVVRAGHIQHCAPYDGSAIRCFGQKKPFAEELILRSGNLMRQCITLQPIQNNHFALHFTKVPLGEALQGSFTLEDAALETATYQKVDFSVSLDGVLLRTFACPSFPGWHKWEIPTPGRTGTVGLVTVQTKTSFGVPRRFCFTAYATRPKG